ncbi:sugar phosphate nucleotidyltransferase [Nitriliruptor alkaliphilus]|uniref:sugar phosphate nucleotidyltransferase n=1 Tax=Nitriliruptor alkaliphilus TaxID=427918 RepID=UPI000697DC20|nr:sugar phosphate nucleotidyltransferase [Nitriliruptor alkaliphilus]
MRHLSDQRLQALLLGPEASIRDAMRCIDQGGYEIALIVDGEGRLLATLTDGDVRRALLGGATLDQAVAPFASARPTTVQPGEDRAAVLDLMRARSIAHIPEVDPEGHLTGVHLLRDVIGAPILPNTAVVMAGGKGTRLGKLTHTTPKPMLPVAGRPILERIVLHLVGSGIRRVVLSIGYLGDQIREHFGDGHDFGCRIDYLTEPPERPLGTGGPLRLLQDLSEPPTAPLLVMNGDLLTSFSVSGILGAHTTAGAVMTIGMQSYVHDIPFGVIHADDAGTISSLEEKPRATWTVNAGTYVIERTLLDRIPAGTPFPITQLAEGCLARGEPVLGWMLDGDWQDIGRPHELRAARGEA